MSYSFYKILHLGSLFSLFVCLGCLLLMAQIKDPSSTLRRWLSILHGIFTVVIFVAGFGLMARLEMMGQSWPRWIYVKIGLWLFVAIAPTLMKRHLLPAKISLALFILAGFTGAYVAGLKPF